MTTMTLEPFLIVKAITNLQSYILENSVLDEFSKSPFNSEGL